MNASELFELRRNNLNQFFNHLIENKRFKNGQEICQYYGLELTAISQLLNSKRAIGEKSARELEQKLQLTFGDLDRQIFELQDAVENDPGLLVYQMKSVHQQAFVLLELGWYGIESFNFKPDHSSYGILVQDDYYQPILRENWCLVCDSAVEIQASSWVCLSLVNELKLILEYQSFTENQHHFQSLDGLKQVSFMLEDILSMHAISAIVAPNQLQKI